MFRRFKENAKRRKLQKQQETREILNTTNRDFLIEQAAQIVCDTAHGLDSAHIWALYKQTAIADMAEFCGIYESLYTTAVYYREEFGEQRVLLMRTMCAAGFYHLFCIGHAIADMPKDEVVARICGIIAREAENNRSPLNSSSDYETWRNYLLEAILSFSFC